MLAKPNPTRDPKAPNTSSRTGAALNGGFSAALQERKHNALSSRRPRILARRRRRCHIRRLVTTKNSTKTTPRPQTTGVTSERRFSARQSRI